MANNIGSTPQSPSHPPLLLVVSVLLLGTVLAWWGTRDKRRWFGESLREPVSTGGAILPLSAQEEKVSQDRGSQISQLQCAGCHQMFARSTGPSYEEIVTFYGRQSAGPNDRSNLLSRLSLAVVHPRPGWGNFAPGPELSLSGDDRLAVASWILSNFQQEKNLSEPTGK
ncbi:MAG TPA: cytochrome c [Candidatus Saccharimonadales bacterium]|nr:cytochrome c [Candidatus Saccharimonadales bacterium]